MAWARSSLAIWLAVSVGAGCSGKYESGPDESQLGGADPGGSGPASSATAGRNATKPYAGSSSAGFSSTTTPAGTSSGGSGSNNPGNEVTLNCGTWIRCDDSSACAAGEDCIALPGCERGICATPSLVCQL